MMTDTLEDRIIKTRYLLRAFTPEKARQITNELIVILDPPLWAIDPLRSFLLSKDPEAIMPQFNLRSKERIETTPLKNAFAKAGIKITKDPIMETQPISTETPNETPPEPATLPIETLAPIESINGNTHPARATKVFWSHTEVRQIAERLALKIFTQFGAMIPEGRSATQGYLLPFLRESQSEMIACGLLPKNRRRDITTLTNLPQSGWEIVKLTLEKFELQKKHRASENGTAPKEEVKVPEPVKPTQETTEFGYQNLSDLELVKEFFSRFSPVAAYEDRLKTIEDTLLDIGSSVEKIGDRFNEIEQRTAKFDERLQKKEVEEKNGLPIVAVVGCRKDIFDRIQEKCLEEQIKIDLRLYEQGTKERPIFCDYAICMKYLSHSWSDHAKKAVGKRTERFTIVLGSVDPVMNQIRAWFATE